MQDPFNRKNIDLGTLSYMTPNVTSKFQKQNLYLGCSHFLRVTFAVIYRKLNNFTEGSFTSYIYKRRGRVTKVVADHGSEFSG